MHQVPQEQSRGGCRVVRFLRSRWARLAKPWLTSIWRRKKQTTARVAAATAGVPVPGDLRDQDQRSRTLTLPGFWAIARTPHSAATLRQFVLVAAALAIVVAAFRITLQGGLSNRWVKFLELMEHPPLSLNCN